MEPEQDAEVKLGASSLGASGLPHEEICHQFSCVKHGSIGIPTNMWCRHDVESVECALDQRILTHLSPPS